MNDDQLRIGDADRDRAAAALGEHYAAGRLTTEEHAERLDAIWAARTRADLVPVFRDLPGPENAVPVRPARPAFLLPLVPLVMVLVLLTVLTHRPFVPLGLIVVAFVLFRRSRRSDWRRTG